MPKRRRGSRSFPMRPAARHQRFDRLVDRAVAGIPQPFRGALDEIALVIEDEPTPEQLRENGLGPDETLYGLYEGVPLDEWGGDWVPIPTRIMLFRLPLEEDFADPDDLADEVRITILHELAHHLGIEDEDRLARARDRLTRRCQPPEIEATPPTRIRSPSTDTAASPGVTHGSHRWRPRTGSRRPTSSPCV